MKVSASRPYPPCTNSPRHRRPLLPKSPFYRPRLLPVPPLSAVPYCPICVSWSQMGQFGKKIQAEQIPGWSEYYLDYKGLKKIVGSLRNTTGSSATTAAAPGSIAPEGVRPSDLFNTRSSTPRGQPPLWDAGVPARAATPLPTRLRLLPVRRGTKTAGRSSKWSRRLSSSSCKGNSTRWGQGFTLRPQSLAEYLCHGLSLSRLTRSTSRRKPSLNCALPLSCRNSVLLPRACSQTWRRRLPLPKTSWSGAPSRKVLGSCRTTS
jgi:hypothetical protein